MLLRMIPRKLLRTRSVVPLFRPELFQRTEVSGKEVPPSVNRPSAEERFFYGSSSVESSLGRNDRLSPKNQLAGNCTGRPTPDGWLEPTDPRGRLKFDRSVQGFAGVRAGNVDTDGQRRGSVGPEPCR
jgi:hypothetical protein